MEITLDSEWSEKPSFHITKAEEVMLAYVVAGGTPENASIASGVGEGWRQKVKFAAYITRVHGHNIATIEAKVFSLIKTGKSIPNGLAFFMKSYAGWHDKWGDDGFAQNITVLFNEVDGTKTEEQEAEEAKEAKKNAKKPSKKPKGK